MCYDRAMIHYAVQTGRFIKDCPCSPRTVSCGYLNLNLHTGCPYRCSYCILQAYLEDSGRPVFYTNISDLETELGELAAQRQNIRIGTGELTDSLAYDPQTQTSRKLLRIFQAYPDMVFEFKTKSVHIRHLMTHPGAIRNIVVSWSLNPQPLVRREEKKTPSLNRRLKALGEIQERGYRVGIHLDPLLIVPRYRSLYRDLIRSLARTIRPDRIAWWSLGALRFPHPLREKIFQHPRSRLFAGELVRGYDDKYRYFKPLRIELFSFVRDQIYRQISRDLPLYLCMEDKETWREIFPGISPRRENINRLLYQSVLG